MWEVWYNPSCATEARDDLPSVSERGVSRSVPPNPATTFKAGLDFYTIMTNTDGYGSNIEFLSKGRTQAAKKKLSKESRKPHSAMMDTFRTNNPREWAEFVSTV